MKDEIEKAYSRLRTVANRTPVLTSRTLNKKLDGSRVFLKCENFQRAGAFKFRGAYNTISQLSPRQRGRGVITHSSGNHAQAVALVGHLLNIKTIIVMPENAPKVKVEATRGYGAEIHFSESTLKAREQLCEELISEHNLTLVHPYDNINVVWGAGTVVLELLQETGPLDYVFAPIGGGGLMSGTSCYSKESGQVTNVIGAEPENADDAYRSFKSGTLVTHHEPNTIADGLRTLLSPLTFDFINKYVDDIITVSEEEIVQATKFLWERNKIIVEPSGAVSLASLIKAIDEQRLEPDIKIGVILSGGNVDLTSYFSTLIN